MSWRRASNPGDIDLLWPRMAPQVREDWLASVKDPRALMQWQVMDSDPCWTWEDSSGPFGIIGLKPCGPRRGLWWGISTPYGNSKPHYLVRELLRAKIDAQRVYATLCGVTDIIQPKVIKLMEFIGAVYGPEVILAGRVVRPWEIGE